MIVNGITVTASFSTFLISIFTLVKSASSGFKVNLVSLPSSFPLEPNSFSIVISKYSFLVVVPGVKNFTSTFRYDPEL